MSIIYPLASLFSLGCNSAVSKKSIHEAGRYRAVVYFYILLTIMLLAAATLLDMEWSIQQGVVPLLVVQIAIGAVAVLARYKALEKGQASIIGPLAKTHVVLVLLIGLFVFGEELGTSQLLGMGVVLAASAVMSVAELGKGRLEAGFPYILITVIGWGIYFSMIKLVVLALGAFKATVVLESGITLTVLLYYFARGRDLSLPHKEGAQLIAASSVLVFIGSMAYNFSVAELGIVLTAAILSGTPIVNAVVSRALLKEKLTKEKHAAILLLVAGLIVIFTRPFG